MSGPRSGKFDAQLIELRPDYSNAQIAALLGRSAKWVSNRTGELGIRHLQRAIVDDDQAVEDMHRDWQQIDRLMRAEPAQNLSWGIA